VNARLDATSSTRYYATLAGRSSDPAMIGKLKAYAAAHVDERSRRETETAAANITDRVRVRALVRPAVAAWLAGGNP
jgi:aminopeptidase N